MSFRPLADKNTINTIRNDVIRYQIGLDREWEKFRDLESGGWRKSQEQR